MKISEIEAFMSEHLKNLKETAVVCDENQLEAITKAMIQTSEFLVKLETDD